MARFVMDMCVASRSPGRMVRRLAKLATVYVESRLADAFEALDLSYTQWIALKVTQDGVVANAGELARELGITTGATTRLVDTLEDHGLLRRDRSADDRRIVRLHLTDAGREVTQKLLPQVVGAWNDIFGELDEAEAQAFVATLTTLYAKAEVLAEAHGAVA